MLNFYLRFFLHYGHFLVNLFLKGGLLNDQRWRLQRNDSLLSNHICALSLILDIIIIFLVVSSWTMLDYFLLFLFLLCYT
jgi:hypothetical protein